MILSNYVSQMQLNEDIQDALRTNVAYIGGLAPENVHLLQFSIVRDEFDNIIVNMAIEIVGENNAHVQAASDAITESLVTPAGYVGMDGS